MVGHLRPHGAMEEAREGLKKNVFIAVYSPPDHQGIVPL